MTIQVNFRETDNGFHVPLLWQWSKRWEANEERIKLMTVNAEDREYETGILRDQDEVFDYLDNREQRIKRTPLTVFLTADPTEDAKRQCILERSAIFAIPNGFDGERYDGIGPVEYLTNAGYDFDDDEARRELARRKSYWQRESENWYDD